MTEKNESKPRVLVSCRRAGSIVDPRTVRRRAKRLLEDLGCESAELSVVLCDDALIQELNRSYRKKNTPTDVLSFPMQGEKSGGSPDLLGDVVISVETAARQAKERGCRPIDEVTALLVHGILHLVGYDHDTPKKRRAMFAEAKRLERLLIRT
jgi:probable rRNA maturation factor